jgi:D-beta-D-heptose 7-phosphate kinase/D-beta-D-heptose 1-phosphate adenosyltransferase
LIGPDAYSSVAELLEVRPIEILNSDASVRRAKGSTRPVNPEQDLISQILPDVLVKGKDWARYVSGRDIVEANGGRVVLAKMVEGRSTNATIERMRGG